MTTFFCAPCESFTGEKIDFTIATVLVILNSQKNKILMTTGKSTDKWQYLGGRYDDSESFVENAKHHGKNILGHTNFTIEDAEHPVLLFDTIDLKGYDEKTLLIHYIATINDESTTGDAQWKNLEEIRMIHAKNQASSDNVHIIAEKLLK